MSGINWFRGCHCNLQAQGSPLDIYFNRLLLLKSETGPHLLRIPNFFAYQKEAFIPHHNTNTHTHQKKKTETRFVYKLYYTVPLLLNDDKKSDPSLEFWRSQVVKTLYSLPRSRRSFIPFSAFWLRSSVVSVLISLISDML